MATAPVKLTAVEHEEIGASLSQFDLNRPLTVAELVQSGMLTVLPSDAKEIISGESMPVFKDINDLNDEPPVDAVAEYMDGSDGYNFRYAHYLRCQALASLAAFEEGWKSLEELVLLEYVRQRQRADREYQGNDPNTAFALRIKRQTAEDFVKFIQVMIAEAISTPKPALEAKK
jgi:hypothetical protein